MRKLALSAAAIALLPGLATAQDRLGWFDLITPDRMVKQMVQIGIMSARTQMDIKYGDMSVDLITGRVTLTDVKMWPLPEWDLEAACEVGIDRMTFRSNPLEVIDRLRFKVQVSGLTAPLDCLPPDARQGMQMAGISELDMPRVTLDVDYGIPGSDAVVHLFSVVEGQSAIDLTADFSYVWIDGREDMDNPEPVIFLRNAALSVENRGFWEAVKGQLPPPMTDPASVGNMVKEVLTGGLKDQNRNKADLNEAQTTFIDSVASALSAFVADPDTLVLETALDGDAFLDLDVMEDDLRNAFETLQPRLALTRSSTADIIPAALLAQAIGPTAGTLSVEDRQRVGMALVTGNGAPRNVAAGLALLTPIAEGGDGAAAMALSHALEVRAPDEAYVWALRAGAGGEEGATARLDRLEAGMPFAEVLRLQASVTGEAEATAGDVDGLSDIREEAAMRLTGNGRARSYAAAALWASLAKAAGDPEAADIMADLDEHVRFAGADAQSAWRAVEAKAGEAALGLWLSRDLPARFGG